MSAICQNRNHLLHQVGIELSVEDLTYLWHTLDIVVEIPDALEANFHNFWLFVFATEYSCFNNCAELIGPKL